MRRVICSGLVLLCVAAALPAVAMSRDNTRLSMDGRASVSDPDERLDRLAAASTANDRGHAKPRKSSRGVLRDDPYLNEAFAWIDNK